jgi:hypothetical protein
MQFQLNYMVLKHLNEDLAAGIRAGIARKIVPYTAGHTLFIGLDAVGDLEGSLQYLQASVGNLTRQQKVQTAVMGAYLMDWLWAKHPANERTFMQQIVQGQDLRQSLASIGEQELEKILPDFEGHVLEQITFVKLFETRDFWALTIGILVLIASLIKVILAAKFAWSHDLGEEVVSRMRPQNALGEEAAFEGPAFGSNAAPPEQRTAALEPPAQTSPSETQPVPMPPKPPVPRKLPPRKEPPPELDFEALEAESEILSVDGVAWEEPVAKEQPPKPPKPPSKPSSANDKRPPKVQSSKLPRQLHQKPTEKESLDSDVDRIFDDLVLGGDD